MAEHELALLPRYARLVARGEKTKEFRLSGRRAGLIHPGDVICFDSLRVLVTARREYPSIADVPQDEVVGSGFASLADLQAALRKIYWYPGAHTRPILVFDLQVLSPQPASPSLFQTP